MNEHQQWVNVNHQLDLYLDLCAHLPDYHPNHTLLREALKRGDLKLFHRLMVTSTWLVVCKILEPDFAALYGSPHLFWDDKTGELRDVFAPVLELFVKGKLR